MNGRLAGLVIGFVVFGAVAGCVNTTQSKNSPEELLAGTGWQLQMLGGDKALAAPQPTLEFAHAGKLSGNGSCNQFSGSVTVSGKSITFGPLASTRMACADEINKQEATYFKALAEAQWFTIGGTTLTIYTKALDEPLVFARAKPK